MDEQFQNVSHTIIDKFLDKVSESCHVKKDVLWALWRDMFSFPTPKALKKSKPKAESKKSDTKVSDPAKPSSEPEKVKEKSPAKTTEPVKELIEPVNELTKEPLKELVTAVTGIASDSKEKTPPKEDVTIDQDKKDKSPKKKRDTCQFKLTRGDRAGQECGKNVAKNSEQFCSYHCK
jgi:hypothetical protein